MRNTAQKKPSRFAAVMGAIGKYTGLSGLAATVVDTHDALIDAAVKAARQRGVPESTIRKALKLKAQHDKAADVLALLFPGMVVSPTALRALAGKPTEAPTLPQKHPAPASTAPRQSKRAPIARRRQ